MDVISEAIGSARTGSAWSRHMKESGLWGMRYSAFAGSGLHVVLSGSGWLIAADGPPRALQAGDVVVVPPAPSTGSATPPARWTICRLRR